MIIDLQRIKSAIRQGRNSKDELKIYFKDLMYADSQEVEEAIEMALNSGQVVEKSWKLRISTEEERSKHFEKLTRNRRI